jgi:hypothetical protein
VIAADMLRIKDELDSLNDTRVTEPSDLVQLKKQGRELALRQSQVVADSDLPQDTDDIIDDLDPIEEAAPFTDPTTADLHLGQHTAPELGLRAAQSRLGLTDDSVESPPINAGYLDGAPGEATKLFMATAGIYRRRRVQLIAALAAGVVLGLLLVLVYLDLSGRFMMPGMGFMYEVAGVDDPNTGRAITRTEEALANQDLSAEERAALEQRRAVLRAKLLGTGKGPATTPAHPRAGKRTPNASSDTEGVKELDNPDKAQELLAAEIMGDDRKKGQGPTLKPPSEIQTPNLPEGLTQAAIFEVINKNQRAMSLCISQSMKAGENLTGRMEVQLTIEASGRVGSVQIGTDRFARTTIGECTVKTVKRWRFPAFNGEAVTVIFPYVLQASL